MPNIVRIFAGLLLVLASGMAQTRPAAPEWASVAVRPVTPEAGKEYAGINRCRACHPAEFTQFSKTLHATMQVPGSDVMTGCETCPGPGKAHADAETAAQGDEAKSVAAKKLIVAFNGNPKQNSERCMGCHNTNNDQKEFGRSTHIRHGVACQDCHSAHLVEAAAKPKATSLPLELNPQPYPI